MLFSRRINDKSRAQWTASITLSWVREFFRVAFKKETKVRELSGARDKNCKIYDF
jgi:hypothetical protein